jgi:hypothetical protein
MDSSKPIPAWFNLSITSTAPANKVNEYYGEHPKFGMFGSIHTAEVCKVARGVAFYSVIFSWMIHSSVRERLE